MADRISGAVEARQPFVMGAFKRVEIAATRLTKRVEEIESRLCPVLRSTTATPGPSNPAESSTVPLADSLTDLADAIDRATDRIQGLLDRLEV